MKKSVKSCGINTKTEPTPAIIPLQIKPINQFCRFILVSRFLVAGIILFFKIVSSSQFETGLPINGIAMKYTADIIKINNGIESHLLVKTESILSDKFFLLFEFCL